MKYSIDRIEENLTVLVNDSGEEITLPVERFSFEPAEGMVVSVGKRCIRRLNTAESKIRKQNSEIMRKLRENK